jgi:hypothetical protein
MDVLHETYHIFQNMNNYLFDSRRWYRESTADYFQSIFVADKRPGTLRHIPHFLQSTHLKLWKGYNSGPPELQHLYGLQLLFHYLDWNGDIDLNFLGKSWNNSNSNETPLEYLIRQIPDFKNKYFDFALKSTVIDFPFWVDKINEQNRILSSNINYSGQRHVLELTDNNIEGNHSPETKIESWGFVSIKLNTSSNQSFNVEFESNNDNFRYGLVKVLNNKYEYSEIEKNSVIDLEAQQSAYIVIVNMNNDFYSDDSYSYSLNISKN